MRPSGIVPTAFRPLTYSRDAITRIIPRGRVLLQFQQALSVSSDELDHQDSDSLATTKVHRSCRRERDDPLPDVRPPSIFIAVQGTIRGQTTPVRRTAQSGRCWMYIGRLMVPVKQPTEPAVRDA